MAAEMITNRGSAAARTEGQTGALLGPVDPSFRALSGRLKFAVRRHKFNKDSLCSEVGRRNDD